MEQLQSALANIAIAINAEVEQEHGLQTLLNPDCSLAMEGYAQENGGMYPRKVIEEDQKTIAKREWDFTGAANANVREFFRKERGAGTEEQVIACWKADKIKSKSSQTEMAVTALLYKMLGRDFIVARTSAYDDYMGGADNVILDKRTGAVVCAFDEIHEDRTGRRLGEKRDKVEKLIQRGGARIRYGIAMEGGKLTRTGLENLPVFYLSLTDADLESLVAGISDSLDSVSPAEEQVFAGLIGSLRQQVETLGGRQNLPRKVKTKLNHFAQSLEGITPLGQQTPRAA